MDVKLSGVYDSDFCINQIINSHCRCTFIFHNPLFLSVSRKYAHCLFALITGNTGKHVFGQRTQFQNVNVTADTYTDTITVYNIAKLFFQIIINRISSFIVLRAFSTFFHEYSEILFFDARVLIANPLCVGDEITSLQSTIKIDTNLLAKYYCQKQQPRM